MAIDRSIEDATGGTGAGRTGAPPPPGPVMATPAAAPEASAPLPQTPADVGGSLPPPPNAGDESPNRKFPVPPVPPPPSPGPIFALAGGGGGGAASFARPGTEAAKPFRSPLFATNRVAAGGGAPMARFGAGTPVTTGGTPSFLPTGLDGQDQAGAAGDEELKRILAIMRGGGA